MDANSGCYTVPILVVVDSLFDLICDIKLVNGADGILDSLSPIFSPQRLEGTFRSKLPVCRRIFQASAQYFLSSSRAESREQRVVKRRYVPPSPFPAWHDSCHNRSKSYLMHPCNPLLKKKHTPPLQATFLLSRLHSLRRAEIQQDPKVPRGGEKPIKSHVQMQFAT